LWSRNEWFQSIPRCRYIVAQRSLGVSGRSCGCSPRRFVEPITWPERAGAALLLAATVYAGLKPDALLGWILPALQSPALQPILRGNTP